MGDFSWLGKMLISLGAFLLFLGVLVLLFGKISGMGRLPGDIFIKRENFTFYFPLATSILLSVLLTVLLNIFFRR